MENLEHQKMSYQKEQNRLNEALKKYLHLNEDEVKKLGRLYNKQNYIIKKEVFISKRKEFNKYYSLTNENNLADILSFYAALILLNNRMNGKNKKNRSMNITDIDDTKYKSKAKSTHAPKSDFVFSKIDYVVYLKENIGLPFRDIADEFNCKHNVSISHSIFHQQYNLYKGNTNV